MPMEDTDSMYQKLSSILISSTIRDNGGFYEVAKTLSTDEVSSLISHLASKWSIS